MDQKITKQILAASQMMEEGQLEGALELIYQGIQLDHRNHELYFMLAQCKELLGSHQQAALSYENALFYSTDEDYGIIEENYLEFMRTLPERPNKVSIVMITYNQLEVTKLCVESIRYNNPRGCYEIIVVDNLSTDGTRQWLQEQEDIKVILNDENKGFPAACNQGAELAAEGNDIFLLNNDTIVMENSIYNLRMALYESEHTGAVGASSNYVSKRQQIAQTFGTIEEYVQYAAGNNCYHPAKHEKRLGLVGFAMLLKRHVWEKVGGLDECYGIGHYEDDDISLKILEQGWDLLFCKDSFIYHFGSVSFGSLERNQKGEFDRILIKNRQIFEEKWKIRWQYFSHVRTELLEYFERDQEGKMAVMEIGCASGATLLELGNRYPDIDLYGMELNADVAQFASHYLNIVQGDITDKQNPFDQCYDYIIFGDVLEHLPDPEDTLRTVRQWLNPGGHLLVSVPNIMHISVLEPLLHGRFTYQEEGILDKTHLKFFTRTELIEMMMRCGFAIERMGGTMIPLSDAQKRYMKKLVEMDPLISEEELTSYQYLLKVKML